MGTSGLFVVKHNNEVKLAQQLNSDAYPTYTLYKFGVLFNQYGESNLINGLNNVELITYDQRRELISDLLEPEGGLKFKNYMKLKEENPTLSQTDFEAIYEQICNSNEVIYSVDRLDYHDDMLNCEWSYKVDLDNNEVSIYRGGNYVKTYSLDSLPDKEECEMIENI